MNSPLKPDDGVSLKVKIFVTLLTIVTVVAFGAFFLRLIFKFPSSVNLSSPAKEESWAYELQIVGDKLKMAGLKTQAIEQYSKFLQYARVDSANRARVAQTIGELYMELGDCREGLVWFYQAQVAGPEPSRIETLESHIDTCLKEIKSERP